MDRIITKLKHIPQVRARANVAAYARVSCGKDSMLHSLFAQAGYYSRYIKEYPNWDFAGVYADEAVTGTKDLRPEFQRLLSDCRRGRIDIVLTKSVSRFARNTVTLLEAVRELKGLGVDVFFEEQKLHSLSGDGELMLTILASYAQEESRSVSENCKWRIRKEFEEGRPSNKYRIYGYEYKDGRLSPVPEEANVVRMIFEDYLSGYGKNAIMKKLIRLGIPTKCGGRWSESTIGAMLANEKYIGDTCLQKCFITDHISKLQRPNHGELPRYYVESSHEAIIERHIFEAVRQEAARRTIKAIKTECGNEQRTYSEFSGLIRCGRCGALFTRKMNSGKVTWACRTYTYKGKSMCPAKRIADSALKDKCCEVLGLSVYDPDVVKAKVVFITVPEDEVVVFKLRGGIEHRVSLTQEVCAD